MEAYTYCKSSAPWSVLAKSGMLSERERMSTVSLIYILSPRGYRPQGGQFRLAVEGDPTQQIWFREICLWQQQPEPWWDEVPGLMALSPLCRQQRPPREVLTHAAEAIATRTPDAIQRSDLLTTLAIFGKLAHPDINVVDLIGREQMKESQVIEEFREEARVEQGREAVLQVLGARFGRRAAAEFRPLLRTVDKLAQLNRLLRIAAQSIDLEQFRARFPKP
jgi:hypothetical protein